QTRAGVLADDNASLIQHYTGARSGFSDGFGLLKIVADARRYIGDGNPTGRRTLWCARFMNMVLHQAGYRGTGSDAARSFASYGRRVPGPRVGAIAVIARPDLRLRHADGLGSSRTVSPAPPGRLQPKPKKAAWSKTIWSKNHLEPE